MVIDKNHNRIRLRGKKLIKHVFREAYKPPPPQKKIMTPLMNARKRLMVSSQLWLDGREDIPNKGCITFPLSPNGKLSVGWPSPQLPSWAKWNSCGQIPPYPHNSMLAPSLLSSAYVQGLTCLTLFLAGFLHFKLSGAKQVQPPSPFLDLCNNNLCQLFASSFYRMLLREKTASCAFTGSTCGVACTVSSESFGTAGTLLRGRRSVPPSPA